MKRSVQELDLGTKIGWVYCVMAHTKVHQVLQLLSLQDVWGCAVIDQNSRLIGNISVTDLKFVLSTEGGKLKLLEEVTVGELLDRCAAVRRPPLTCNATDSLETVVKALARAKVHRIYVVNANQQPQGVITLTDIIDTIARVADSRTQD
jgi:CBS domain-containing protein